LENIPQFSSSLTLSGLSWDIAAIFFVAILIFLFGLTSGRDRLLALLLSLYAASTIASTSPQVLSVFVEYGIRVSSFTKLEVFLVLFLLLSFLLSGKIFSNIFQFSAEGLKSLWQVIVLSLLIAGLFISLFLQFLPYNTLAISSGVAYIFRDGLAPFLWAAVPVLFLIFLRAEEE